MAELGRKRGRKERRNDIERMLPNLPRLATSVEAMSIIHSEVTDIVLARGSTSELIGYAMSNTPFDFALSATYSFATPHNTQQ